MEQDIEFIQKRSAYCVNKCNFTCETTSEVTIEPTEEEPGCTTKTTQMLMYCTGCGFSDPIDFT